MMIYDKYNIILTISHFTNYYVLVKEKKMEVVLETILQNRRYFLCFSGKRR